MAKTKHHKDSLLTPILEGAKHSILGTINQLIREKIHKWEKMGLELVLASMFFFFSVLFLLTGVVFLFREVMNWSYFMSFIGAGVIAMLICYMIYSQMRKN